MSVLAFMDVELGLGLDFFLFTTYNHEKIIMQEFGHIYFQCVRLCYWVDVHYLHESGADRWTRSGHFQSLLCHQKIFSCSISHFGALSIILFYTKETLCLF